MSEEHARRKLLIRLPSGDTQAQVIQPDVPLSIGRGDTNTIVIRKPGVADQHCSIVVVEDQVVLVSVSPSAPTLVNGNPVERVHLKDGDHIVVGPIEMTYCEAAAAAASVPGSVSTDWSPSTTAVSARSAPAKPARDDRPGRAPRATPGLTPKKSGPSPGRRRNRLLWVAVCLGLVAVAAGGTYVLWSAERFKIDRHRKRVAKAMEEGRFKRARDEVRAFIDAFPDAPDVAEMEEAALYATIRDRLGSRVMERLSETHELVRQYLDRFPNGQWRETLLARACGDYLRQATVLIERGELTGANLARAENLLGLARSLSRSLPGEAFNPQSITAAQARIEDRRDNIQFQEALTNLRNAGDLALTQQEFDDFFERLRQIQTLWPVRELPDGMAKAIAEIRAAERNSASLVDTDITTHVVPPPSFAPFRRHTVSVRYESVGQAAADGRRLCLIHGSTLYALDAGSGQLAWSQPVAHYSSWPPLVSPEHATVLTAQGANGLAAWRCSDGVHRWSVSFDAEVLGPPAILGDHLYVLTANGDLLRLSLDGEVTGRCRLREPFDQPGTFDPRSDSWVGISTNGTLFKLDLSSGKCVCIARAVCRGHQVVAPPIVVGPFVCVAEANLSRQTSLRVLRIDGSTAVEHSTHQLKGWMHRPAVVGSGIVALATDAGMTYLFACNSTDLNEGVFPIGEFKMPVGEEAATLTALDVSFRTVRLLHITDYIATVTFDLMTGEVDVAEESDTPTAEIGGACTAAISAEDDLFVAAACPDSDGLAITRLSRRHPQRVRWKTVLGLRAYPFPLADRSEPSFISERGGILRLPAAALASTTLEEITLTLQPPTRGFKAAHVFEWDQSSKRALLCTTDATLHRATLAAFEWNGQWRRLWSCPLPEQVATPPLLCGDVLLIVLRSGRIGLIDLHRGAPRPRWTAGLAPFTAAAGRRVTGTIQLVPHLYAFADGGTIYFLSTSLDRPSLKRAPVPDQLKLDGDVLSLVVAGEYAYITDESGQLVVCEKAGLEPVERYSLERGTRTISLPNRSAVLGYSPTGLLTRFDGTVRSWVWIPPVTTSVLAEPVVTSEVVVLTSNRGEVYVLEQDSGNLLESYRAPLTWSAPVRPTPAHLVGVTRNGEVWSCVRNSSPNVNGSADEVREQKSSR